MHIQSIASSSSGNSYAIHHAGHILLLECGISFKKIQQSINFKISNVCGCLLTHMHLDHSSAAKDLVRAGIDIYTSKETAEAIRLTGHRTHHIHPGIQFSIGGTGWHIMPFDVEHDCPGSLGFLISTGKSKILFLTDTAYCKYMFNGITNLMIEANFCEKILKQNADSGLIDIARAKRVLQSHMSIQRVKSFIAANDMSKLESVHLMHLSAASSDAKRFKKEIQAIVGVPVYVCGE